jgi:hypothetical protein
MSIQEILGWAMSIINMMGLQDLVKAVFVTIVAATAIYALLGRKAD